MTRVARAPRPPQEEDVRSGLRAPEVAARVGVWLGVCFGVAFLTGVFSHLHQDQPGWLVLPSRPVWLYQATQGLHYLTGVASVPLLLVKMYAVYPRLFIRPPRARRDLLLHLLERASVAVLVAAAVFQLVTGVANSSQWYPWAFSFRSTHHAVAYVAIGAVLVHVAVKLPVIREALARPVSDGEPPTSGLTRRGLLRATWLASGVGVLSVAGGSVPWLHRVSVFENHYLPGGVPVNKTARAAAVRTSALDPAYALVVTNGTRSVRLGRDELARLPQHTARLPIACVEGWSATGSWTGVRLRDLVDLVGAAPAATVHVHSLQSEGPFRASEVRGNVVDDPLTLVALGLNGAELSLDHGYPCRLIAPGRPGVLQTKWLARIEVVEA